MTPNVVCMLKYYDMNSPRRAFYSSSDKDDDIGYIDKGIKSNKEIDKSTDLRDTNDDLTLNKFRILILSLPLIFLFFPSIAFRKSNIA